MNSVITWRVIHSGHCDAYRNMAVDEAIMESVGRGEAPPTLRIYGWRPPGVSLGRFQGVDQQVDIAAVHQRGWGLVRRPTGGRAILHDDEVTYSVCVSQDQIEDGHSVLRSYRYLAQGIQQGLQLLGVEAQLGRKPHSGRNKSHRGQQPAICFTQSTRADMVVAGRKIVGSAQVRRHRTILQHGSVPITLNIADHLAVMPDNDTVGEGEALSRAAVGVSDLLGRNVSYDELAEALVAGFGEALGLELQAGQLTDAEEDRAGQLRAEKYTTDEWNLVRPPRT